MRNCRSKPLWGRALATGSQPMHGHLVVNTHRRCARPDTHPALRTIAARVTPWIALWLAGIRKSLGLIEHDSTLIDGMGFRAGNDAGAVLPPGAAREFKRARSWLAGRLRTPPVQPAAPTVPGSPAAPAG